MYLRLDFLDSQEGHDGWFMEGSLMTPASKSDIDHDVCNTFLGEALKMGVKAKLPEWKRFAGCIGAIPISF